jgi:hypothetical protein
MYICACSHPCGAVFLPLMCVLNLADGLCCTGYVYAVLSRCYCRGIGVNYIDWVKLHIFQLKTEKGSTMCINILIEFIFHRHKFLDLTNLRSPANRTP